MQSPDSVEIIGRFFTCIEKLKETKKIRGKATFYKRYNIDRQNAAALERDNTRQMFQVGWLFYLVRDYGVSAEWLLTGYGEMFTYKPTQ